MRTIGIKQLSARVMSKLRNGHKIKMLPGDMEIHVSEATHGRLSKAVEKGRGVTHAFDEDELAKNGGEGILGHKFDNVLKKIGIKKAVYKVGAQVAPILTNAITSLGAQGGPEGMQIANVANDYINHPSSYGQGIFGHKVDRLLKKAGVKKLAYKVGAQLQPMASKAIHDYAGSDPNAQILANTADDYLQHPHSYGQGMGGNINSFIRGGVHDVRSTLGIGMPGQGGVRPNPHGGNINWNAIGHQIDHNVMKYAPIATPFLLAGMGLGSGPMDSIINSKAHMIEQQLNNLRMARMSPNVTGFGSSAVQSLSGHGSGLYAGSGVKHHRHAHASHRLGYESAHQDQFRIPPALRSQPYAVNWQQSLQLPVQFQAQHES